LPPYPLLAWFAPWHPAAIVAPSYPLQLGGDVRQQARNVVSRECK